MGKKGQVYIYLAFVVVILLAGGLSWIYLKDQAVFGGFNIPILSFLQPKTSLDTKNWKQFEITANLQVLYPPTWLVVENKYLSQYPYTPGKVSNDVYNAISAQLITNQIQTSYANEDWVNGLVNAKKDEIVVNQYRPSDQNLAKYKKVDSGKTLKGDSFVLFQDTKDPSIMYAYLMLERTKIYQFTLNNFDQAGQDYFTQIISTAQAN